MYIYETLKHVSATDQTLTLVMGEDAAVHLKGDEVRMLAEVANAAPGLLHENRLVRRVAEEARHGCETE